ncbi:MAG TPA: ABC transporter permease [Gaiellaceae bacterium]|nr:ABC transporter permease [Gaiellaceae bacterium]
MTTPRPTPKWVGVGGVACGLAAFWIALPPIHARNIAIPVLFAALAVVLGIVAARAGEVRVGWGSIVLGFLGLGGAYLASRSSVDNLEIVFTWSTLIASMLVFATPLIYGSLGGIFSERSGVVNIGLEGMMLMGAFWGIWGADKTGNWVTGVLIGMAAGGLLGLLHAVFSVHLRADQIIGGTAINLLAIGITGYAFVRLYGSENIPAGVSEIPRLQLRFLERIPPDSLGDFLYGAFGRLSVMIWVGLLFVLIAHFVLFKTPLGLRLRSVGEHPRAADTVGISVYGMRYLGVTLSGILAGAGGAFLSVGVISGFNENMTAGRGFIALAAVIAGNWRPFGSLFFACLFGFSTALAFRLGDAYRDSVAGLDVLAQMLPYILTLIIVAGVIGKSIPPAAVGRPYTKQ